MRAKIILVSDLVILIAGFILNLIYLCNTEPIGFINKHNLTNINIVLSIVTVGITVVTMLFDPKTWVSKTYDVNLMTLSLCVSIILIAFTALVI